MSLLDKLSLGFGKKLPMILQTEAAECGLACIAMVLGYHGTATDLPSLRNKHNISLKGVTLESLCKIAQQEDLGYRAMRLELNELNQLKTPCILHWDLNHFVVLDKVQGNTVTIHDPGFGTRRLSMDEVSKKFTGVALELWPSNSFVAKEDKQSISLTRLIGKITGFLPSLTNVLLISLALEIFALLNPLFMQWVIDQVLISKDLDLLTTLAIGFLLLAIVQQVFTMFRSWILLSINTAITVQWESNIFSHLLKLPISYFQSRHLGDVVSRAQASTSIQQVLTSTFVETIFDGIFAIVGLIMMYIYSPTLTWVALIAIVLYIIIRIIWYRPFYHATEEQIIRAASRSSHFLESIRGARAITIFGRQHERLTTWQSLLINETNASITVSKLGIFYTFVSSLLTSVIYVVLIYMGAKLIMENELSVGMLMAFLAYRGQFNTRIMALINKYIDLRMLRIQTERLADIVLTPPESESEPLFDIVDKEQAIDIRFDNLQFNYADDDPMVLNNLSLEIKNGESIAIVGPSGCGKTTLVNMLIGTYKPKKGQILINNTALDKYGVNNWRSQLGIVMQDDSLFAGSIADNICFFDSKPDFEKIQHVAKLAAVHDDIEMMPMGYQTLIGDMGTVLSGGQKQRVLMARSLYKDPQVLILDEATSHLDIHNELQVNKAIAGLNMTRIIIAHRPDTIKMVDRVVELMNGQVSFDGTPSQYLHHLNIPRGNFLNV